MFAKYDFPLGMDSMIKSGHRSFIDRACARITETEIGKVAAAFLQSRKIALFVIPITQDSDVGDTNAWVDPDFKNAIFLSAPYLGKQSRKDNQLNAEFSLSVTLFHQAINLMVQSRKYAGLKKPIFKFFDKNFYETREQALVEYAVLLHLYDLSISSKDKAVQEKALKKFNKELDYLDVDENSVVRSSVVDDLLKTKDAKVYSQFFQAHIGEYMEDVYWKNQPGYEESVGERRGLQLANVANAIGLYKRGLSPAYSNSWLQPDRATEKKFAELNERPYQRSLLSK